MSEETKVPSRDNIRAQILRADNKKGDFEIIEFFGSEIELRQPTIGDMQRMGDLGTARIDFTRILIDYAYVPGTNEKVFEEGDMQTLEQLPFNSSIQRVVNVIERFTDLSVEDAEKNSE